MMCKLPQRKTPPARGGNLPVINPSVTKPRFRALPYCGVWTFDSLSLES